MCFAVEEQLIINGELLQIENIQNMCQNCKTGKRKIHKNEVKIECR